MKKLLALVLALVMTLGLATVSSSAAFSDAEKIDHTEAVEVMNALNIINGMGDGTFQPDGNVTRAQMAKMVTIALLGDVEVSAFTGTATDLKDVSGHWAEAYIKYCYSQGIISGRGNGIFDPNANVTTAEASKMLLVALGYNADVRKYTGDQWAINVARDAQQKGLYDEISNLTSGKAMDRDDAAQLIYNTLTARRVVPVETYNSDGSISTQYINAGTAGTPAAGEPATLLNASFKGSREYGYMTGVSYDSAKKLYTYTFTDGSAVGTNLGDDVTATPDMSAEDDVITVGSLSSATDYSALWGQRVAVVYDRSAKTNTEQVYGIYSDADVIVEGVIGDIENLATTSTATELKFDNVKYKLTAAGGAAATSIYAYKNTTAADTLDDADTQESAFSYKAIDNTGDGKIDLIIEYPFAARKVTFANATSFTIATFDGNTSFKFADVAADGTYAKDDIIVGTAKANAADGKNAFAKAELVEGKISGTKTGQVMVNGTWYKAADTLVAGSEAIALNDTVKLYVVNGYYVFADATTATSKDILVAIAANGANAITKLSETKVIKTNGTGAEIVNVSKIDGTEGAVATAGTLYTYEVTSAGNYELKTATTANTGYDAAITGTNYTQGSGVLANGVRINADTVVMIAYKHSTSSNTSATTVTTGVDNLTKYMVMTGKDLDNWSFNFGATGSTQGFAKTENGFSTAKVLFLAADLQDLGATGDTLYGYITSAPYQGQEGSTKYVYFDLWNGTTNESVKEKASSFTYAKGDVVSYYDDGNGVVKSVTAFSKTGETGTLTNAEAGAVVAWDGKYIQVAVSKSADGNAKIHAATETVDKTKYLYIDSKEIKGVEGGEIAMAEELATAGTYVPNVYIVGKNADDVVLVVIDTGNKLCDPSNTDNALCTIDARTIQLTGLNSVTTSNWTTVVFTNSNGNSMTHATDNFVEAGETVTVTATAKVGGATKGFEVKLDGTLITGAEVANPTSSYAAGSTQTVTFKATTSGAITVVDKT